MARPLRAVGSCLSLIFLFLPVSAQDGLVLTLDGKPWKQSSLAAGVESAAGMTLFAVNAATDKEKIDLFVDVTAIRGKGKVTFELTENLMAPPGGASISYRPAGTKEHWTSGSGTYTITSFDEKTKKASGTFEATLVKMLDDKGGFVLTMPKPSKNVSGSFRNLTFRVAE